MTLKHLAGILMVSFAFSASAQITATLPLGTTGRAATFGVPERNAAMLFPTTPHRPPIDARTKVTQ
jgi:hypothetical protein